MSEKSKNQTKSSKVLGFKATKLNGKCKDYQFSLPTKNSNGEWIPGKWHKHEGEVILCKSGFHFCTDPDNIFEYYISACRIFEVECKEVLSNNTKKLVCKKIRFLREVTEEIFSKYNIGNLNKGRFNTGNDNRGCHNTGGGNDGDRNSGSCNLGWGNTHDFNNGHANSGRANAGNRNTGDNNVGDQNTGDDNSGNWNTGSFNTGSRNTDHHNKGDSNSGYGNTGHRNSGGSNLGNHNSANNNSGDYNSGFGNSGNHNTGIGNATSYQPGFFCRKEPKVKCFDKPTGLTASQFLEKYGRTVEILSRAIVQGKVGPVDKYPLPNITQEALDSLVEAHAKAREKKKDNMKKYRC